MKLRLKILLLLFAVFCVLNLNAQAQEKTEAPNSKEYATALKTVESVLGSEMRVRDKAKRVELAKRLMSIAKEEKSGTTTFVLLQEAREHAAEGGALELALSAIQELDKHYVVDSKKLIDTDIKTSFSKIDNAKDFANAINITIEVAEKSADSKDLDFALEIIEHARRAARKTKDPQFIAQVEAPRKRLLEVRKLTDAYEKAKTKLEIDPTDDKSRIIVGNYLCFVAKQNEEGLNVLKESISDNGDAARAELKLASPHTEASASSLADVAQQWFELGKTDKSMIGGRMNSRSAEFLMIALNKAQGLEKKKIEDLLVQVREAGTDGSSGNVVQIACLRPWKVTWANGQTMENIRFTPDGKVSWKNTAGNDSRSTWRLDQDAIVFGEKMIVSYRFHIHEGNLIGSLVRDKTIRESQICQPDG